MSAWCLLALEDLDLLLVGLLFLRGMGESLGGVGTPVGSRILGVSGILFACLVSWNSDALQDPMSDMSAWILGGLPSGRMISWLAKSLLACPRWDLPALVAPCPFAPKGRWLRVSRSSGVGEVINGSGNSPAVECG